MYHFTKETDDDYWEVEALFDLCFAPGREALSSYRLRDSRDPVWDLCYVARDSDGVLAGAIRFWHVEVAGHTILILGPVAVHPTRQGEGLGGLLMQTSLQQAAAQSWDRVMLVGDEPYYRRFGFTKLTDIKMPPPTNPDRVLGLALTKNAWGGIKGVVTTPNV